MKLSHKSSCAALLIGSAIAASSASAAVYTLPDIVRSANGAATTQSSDFFTGSSPYSGTPTLGDTITGETSLYLKYTVSWTANSSIGTFGANFYVNDGGGAPRFAVPQVGPGALRRRLPVDAATRAKRQPFAPDMFLYINPNLGATEASQSTIFAQWRSGNGTFRGINFTTDTDQVPVTFSGISLYTGADTPFSLVPEPSTALLGALGFLALLRRRR